MFEKFTDNSRLALGFAQEAARTDGSQISVEHVLVGLTKVNGSFALRVLTELKVDTEKLNADLCAHLGAVGQGNLDVKNVIVTALTESKLLGHPNIGTEHLLLGVLKAGIAGNVLQRHGFERDVIILQIHRLRESGVDDGVSFF